MKSPFADVLTGLTRQRGVLGSMMVGESDGLIIDSALQIGVKGAVVAALAASLYRRARLSADAAGVGTATFLQLEAERGRLCAVGRNDLVLVALAELRANVGMLRIEMLRALETLE